MKKSIKLLIIFTSGIFIGMLLYKNKWFPTPLLVSIKRYFKPPTPPIYDHIDMIITQYTKGMPLFSDRTYHDTIGDKALESLYLIQIPRHRKFPIEFESSTPIEVLRLVSDANDNQIFEDWEKSDIKVYVKGASCIHTGVVTKTFEPGKITLSPGGPVASSPILIRDLSGKIVNPPFILLHRNNSVL